MEPTNQSLAFAGFDRIDKEIEVLRSKLQPVTKSLPSAVKENTPSLTALDGRIRSIESNLADLIDLIEI
jgi:hypothetical protein